MLPFNYSPFNLILPECPQSRSIATVFECRYRYLFGTAFESGQIELPTAMTVCFMYKVLGLSIVCYVLRFLSPCSMWSRVTSPVTHVACLTTLANTQVNIIDVDLQLGMRHYQFSIKFVSCLFCFVFFFYFLSIYNCQYPANCDKIKFASQVPKGLWLQVTLTEPMLRTKRSVSLSTGVQFPYLPSLVPHVAFRTINSLL